MNDALSVRNYENAVRSGRLWADVALDGKGNARLEGLVIE
jgi:hypothetical protein